MPTDNPKISLYVPQQIYDRFKTFQEEKKLSMSQAGIVVLAEYFGLEETIKEITEGTTIGGITLSEFEDLKQRVLKLESLINQVSQERVEKIETTSELLSKQENNKLQLELTGESIIKPITGTLLSRRFGMKKNAASDNKKRKTIEDFALWSQSKDPDSIAWIPVEKGYATKDELPNELLNKLQDWIAQNT